MLIVKKVKLEELMKYAEEQQAEETRGIKIGDMEIEVLQSLSITDKLKLAGEMYYASVKDEDDRNIIDRGLFHVVYKTSLIETYTNLTLPESSVEAYNLIVDTGLFDEVYYSIGDIERSELERVMEDYFRQKQEEYEQEHGMGVVIQTVLGSLVDMIPSTEEMGEMFGKLGEGVEDLDYDGLQDISEAARELGSEKEHKAEDDDVNGEDK